jgi:hypothetical protein
MKHDDASSVRNLAQRYLQQTDKSPELAAELDLFCAKVEAPTLAARVRTALTFRQQGHFDKAMLAMSAANRDQVLALRKLQSILSGVTGKHFPMVVLESFRQQPPFEIGIADGAPVFTALDRLGAETSPDMHDARTKLHDAEAHREEEDAFVTYLERQPPSDGNTAEFESAQNSIRDLDSSLSVLRATVLEAIFGVAEDILDSAAIRGQQRDGVFLNLAANLYVVVMSSIATKPARRVTS